MINADSFISGTLNTVDMVIGNFVSNAYMNFVQANAGLITLMFTVYVMFLGFQFLNHTQNFNLHVVTKHIIVMLFVYGLVMNWHLYHLFVYNIFTNEPGNIAKVLVSSSGTYQVSGGIVATLDGIYAAVVNATIGFFSQVGFSGSGIAFLFYGVMVYVIGSMMCVFALLLFVYAKMMMAISLALGPIFIPFFLWEPTKGIFAAWIRKLITLSLIPIVTSTVLVLMLSVINVTLPNVSQPVEHLQFYGIAPFLGLSLATTMILSQVFRISSSLGGGIALASISAGATIASAALQKSGIASTARSATNWSQKQVRQAQRKLLKREVS